MIYIGSDHAGFELKNKLIKFIKNNLCYMTSLEAKIIITEFIIHYKRSWYDFRVEKKAIFQNEVLFNSTWKAKKLIIPKVFSSIMR